MKLLDGKRMTDEGREIGKFLFGLKVFKKPDGSFEYKIQSLNDNIPVEIVIMQLKAFLASLEKEYFESFERGSK